MYIKHLIHYLANKNHQFISKKYQCVNDHLKELAKKFITFNSDSFELVKSGTLRVFLKSERYIFKIIC